MRTNDNFRFCNKSIEKKISNASYMEFSLIVHVAPLEIIVIPFKFDNPNQGNPIENTTGAITGCSTLHNQ